MLSVNQNVFVTLLYHSLDNRAFISYVSSRLLWQVQGVLVKQVLIKTYPTVAVADGNIRNLRDSIWEEGYYREASHKICMQFPQVISLTSKWHVWNEAPRNSGKNSS